MKILIGIRNALRLIEKLFFPLTCQGCGEVGTYLCDRCVESKVKFVKRQKCHLCKTTIKGQRSNNKYSLVHKECSAQTSLDGVIVIAEYSKFLEDYLGDIKYEFYYAMIPDLVQALISHLEAFAPFQQATENATITYVPLHIFRKRWRGFNQAEKIAKGIGEHFNTPVVKLLKRKRRTKTQVGLKRGERLSNLSEAFCLETSFQNNRSVSVGVSKQKLKHRPKHVLIVDDVMTSGATLEECARVLKSAGCETVYGLVVARG